jgi:hypothetical protein
MKKLAIRTIKEDSRTPNFTDRFIRPAVANMLSAQESPVDFEYQSTETDRFAPYDGNLLPSYSPSFSPLYGFLLEIATPCRGSGTIDLTQPEGGHPAEVFGIKPLPEGKIAILLFDAESVYQSVFVFRGTHRKLKDRIESFNAFCDYDITLEYWKSSNQYLILKSKARRIFIG